MKYFFILGRTPKLSIAEITSILHKEQIQHNLYQLSDEVAIVTGPPKLDTLWFEKTSGGTVKVGEIVKEIPLEDSEDALSEALSADFLLANVFPQRDSTLRYGISIYDGGGERILLKKLEEQIPDFSKKIKQNLEEAGKKAGFIQMKERIVSTASVEKNNLLTKGAEIVCILTNDAILLGKTDAIQEFQQFSFRDYSRPQRDLQAGTMPPKLARMMINLARIEEGQTILDPFCGSGTVIQEAIYLGYKKIIGTDITQKAIQHSKENIAWLFDHMRALDKNQYSIMLKPTDVKKLTEHVKENSVDAIVTEPHLGPTVHRRPTIGQIKHITQDLLPLYLAAFDQFKKVVKTGGKIVIILPAYWDRDNIVYMNILPLIKEKSFSVMPLDSSERGSIIVGNERDFVLREIVTFKKS